MDFPARDLSPRTVTRSETCSGTTSRRIHRESQRRYQHRNREYVGGTTIQVRQVTGSGLRGVTNTFEATKPGTTPAGSNLFNQDKSPADFPSVPGGDADTALSPVAAIPVRFADNVTAANLVTGLEYWGVNAFAAISHIAAFNGAIQFLQAQSEFSNPHLVTPTLVGSGGQSTCVKIFTGYVPSLTIDGGLRRVRERR